MAELELNIEDLKDISGGTEIVKIPGLASVVPPCPSCGNTSASDLIFMAWQDSAANIKCRKCGGSIRLANKLALAGDKGGAVGLANIES